MKSEQLLLLNPKSSDKRQRCSPTALVFTGPLIWDSTCTGVILLLPSALLIPFLYLSVQKTQQESLTFPFSCLFFSPECSSPLIERVYIQLRIIAIIPHQIKHDIRFMFMWGCPGFLVPFIWGLPATLALQMSMFFPLCYNLLQHLKCNIRATKLPRWWLYYTPLFCCTL